MNRSPKISVIMPVYNGGRYLASAIESVLEQSYGNLELILADDGSTDGSPDIITRYRPDERVVSISTGGNYGVAAARNFALKHASGNLIAFLDQDDVWLPDKLKLQVQLLADHPGVALVHSYVVLIDENGELSEKHRGFEKTQSANAPIKIEIADIFAALFMRNDIQVLTVLVRKAVY